MNTEYKAIHVFLEGKSEAYSDIVKEVGSRFRRGGTVNSIINALKNEYHQLMRQPRETDDVSLSVWSEGYIQAYREVIGDILSIAER
jgi:hypothetical protein